MPESDALTNLRQALSNLRRVVGPYLTITRQTVACNQESDYWLDVQVFQDRIEAAVDAGAVEKIWQVIAPYQGDFLIGS